MGCLSPDIVPGGGSGLDGGGGGDGDGDGDGGGNDGGEGEARGEVPTFFSLAGILSSGSMNWLNRSILAMVFWGASREASVANFPFSDKITKGPNDVLSIFPPFL